MSQDLHHAMVKNAEVTTSDKRDEAFQNLKVLIIEAPLKADYKIDLLNALSAYIKTLN